MKAKDIDTVISASVVGHPVRAIKNKLATEYNQAEKDFLAGKKTQEEIEEFFRQLQSKLMEISKEKKSQEENNKAEESEVKEEKTKEVVDGDRARDAL